MTNVKRLIDANDALERLKKAEKEMNVVSLCGCKAVPMDGVIDFVASRPTVDAVPVADIEAWLYQIAMNNTGNPLCEACEEIIRRLDGLRTFSRERDNEND